jgi:hypothetical protein
MTPRRSFPLAVLLLVAPVLTACSWVGDVRRPVPTPPPASRPAPPAPSSDVEERRADVRVPDGYDPPTLGFTDAEHGYALFGSCPSVPPSTCPALLYATLDGGRSWRALSHPRPVAEGHEMVVAPGALALHAGPRWYLSRDGGGTFQQFSASAELPAPVLAAQNRWQVEESEGGVSRWDGSRFRPVAAPPVPGLTSVWEGRDGAFAAGVRGGRAYTAVSTDQGRSWRPAAVPAVGAAPPVLRVAVAADGEEWLVGEGSGGGLPALWVWRGSWRAVRPEAGPRSEVLSVVPLGNDTLAVTTGQGAGLVVGGRYAPVGWPVRDGRPLLRLKDGTLSAPGSRDTLLGVGSGTDRRWIRISFP